MAGAAVLVLLVSVSLPAGASASAALPALQHLDPGQRADVEQQVPITTVFVGLEPGIGTTLIDESRFLETQPRLNHVGDRTTRYFEREGVPRMQDWLDRFLEPSTIGLTYHFDHEIVVADTTFEDAFFGYLASIAVGPIPNGTAFMQAYSQHPLAAQQIEDAYAIDATAVERWLATNAGPMLGVDTTRPTVFFINWFGRSDFRFHTYAFMGQRPDVPFPLGATHVGQMVAWGGSPADAPYGALGQEARLWFYDVSAGPDYGTANWLLDAPDITGDGVTDDRIPPIWEYGTTHWYRPFDDLTDDLGAVMRFVAVDALFGPSPLYDPAISEPLLAESIELDLNVFAGRPGRDPLSSLRDEELPAVFHRLDPTRQYTVDTDVAPLTGLVGTVFDCQQSSYTAQARSCYGKRSQLDDDPETSYDERAFFDLDLYFGASGPQYLDGTRYEVPLAVFDVAESRLAPGAIAGYASSRFPNVQRWTYTWLADRFRFGALESDTKVVTHEIGHHLGLTHVHDGYDPDLDRDFTADGPFWFTIVGIETYTVMSYLPNSDEFGQFDRDHLARWQVATRLDNANRILGDVARSPRAGNVTATVAMADAKAGEALAALAAWNLPAASMAAAASYRLVLDAAAGAGVTVEPYDGEADHTGIGVIEAATDRRGLGPPLPPGATEATSYLP